MTRDTNGPNRAVSWVTPTAPVSGRSRGARAWRAGLALVLGLTLLPASVVLAAAQGTWNRTGSLSTPRSMHTATLLPNGKVLVAGGVNDTFAYSVSSAELYDPANGTWNSTGSLRTARLAHTATLLPDGKVLVAGGLAASGTLTSAELYDPISGTWYSTGSLQVGLSGHTATLLPNGKVLVVGGGFDAELYDPATATWSITGRPHTGRSRHTATLLPNGKVLVAGGFDSDFFAGDLSTAELYDPASGTWTFTGSLHTGRFDHTATLLPDGNVLVVGGSVVAASTASAELYDPASGTWRRTGSLNISRENAPLTVLPNGSVLVVGGENVVVVNNEGPSTVIPSTELYDPVTGTWSQTGSLNTPRARHTVTLLPDGTVLAAAGTNAIGGGAILASAELYTPPAATPACTTTLSGPQGMLVIQGDGATCLQGAQVVGAVLVRPGARLLVDHSTISGAIVAEAPAFFGLCDTTAQGAVVVTHATGFVLVGDPGDDACGGNTIRGSVLLLDNHHAVEVAANHIEDNLTVSDTSGAGPFAEDSRAEIERNVIRGALVCSGNVVAPTNDGQPNTVTRTGSGQCAGL